MVQAELTVRGVVELDIEGVPSRLWKLIPKKNQVSQPAENYAKKDEKLYYWEPPTTRKPNCRESISKLKTELDKLNSSSSAYKIINLKRRIEKLEKRIYRLRAWIKTKNHQKEYDALESDVLYLRTLWADKYSYRFRKIK